MVPLFHVLMKAVYGTSDTFTLSLVSLKYGLLTFYLSPLFRPLLPSLFNHASTLSGPNEFDVMVVMMVEVRSFLIQAKGCSERPQEASTTILRAASIL